MFNWYPRDRGVEEDKALKNLQIFKEHYIPTDPRGSININQDKYKEHFNTQHNWIGKSNS